jgi:LysR family transcriptional regulator, regulator of abg operon
LEETKLELDSRRLRDLLQIIKDGTITGAARSLNISQPALSNSIKIMEHHLGVKLLTRDRKGSYATEYGEILTETAQVISAVLSGAIKRLEDRKAGYIGTLAIGTAPIGAAGLVPKAVSQLITKTPRISISIIEGHDDFLFDKLRNREIDLIVCPLGRGEEIPDIADIVLSDDQYFIISNPENPLTQSKFVTLKKLQNAHWILPESTTASRKRMELLFITADLAPPSNIINSNSILATKSLVVESNCISIMSRRIVAAEEAAGILRVTPLKTAEYVRTIGIRTLRDRNTSILANLFIQTLKSLIN